MAWLLVVVLMSGAEVEVGSTPDRGACERSAKRMSATKPTRCVWGDASRK